MSEKVVARMVIATAGIAVFFTGVRTDLALVRWVGIALVAVALALRFVGRGGASR